MRRLRARLSAQSGHSLVELVISMSILGSVMASVSVLRFALDPFEHWRAQRAQRLLT